jgi:hypothetical protein
VPAVRLRLDQTKGELVVLDVIALVRLAPSPAYQGLAGLGLVL